MPPENKARVQVLGDDLLGVSGENPVECQDIARQLRESGAWLEVVPGIASVVVQFDAAETDLGDGRLLFEQQLASLEPASAAGTSAVEIPVCYGGEFGPDLDAVCAELGLTSDEFIAAHSGGEYSVEMLGFTPGFAYVGGLPEELNVPRLGEPRQFVAAGSVGIAGGRTGLYSLAGPGGWPLVGRTPLKLFDGGAEKPFLLAAGMHVRFTSIDTDQFGAWSER